LNYRGAVATIIGLPLAILFAWVAQSNAGGDTVRVNSSNQQGGITANTVNITTPPGALQHGASNKALAIPDKELLAITLQNQSDALQQYQAMYARCKAPSPGLLDWCNTVRSSIATTTATFNKMCRDNDVPRGNYGCP
jgi:hypothetical protein